MRLTDEQIGAELTALREVPSEEFAASLDAWAEAGFPSLKELTSAERKLRGEPQGIKRLITRRPLFAGLAASATVIALIGVSLGVYLHNRNQSELFSGSAKNDVEMELSAPSSSSSVPESGNAAAGTAATPSPGLSGKQVSRPRNARQQIQERTAQVGLATDSDKIQDAAGGVLDVTDRYDGIVDSSNVHTGGSRGRASFQLRIPTQHLQDALADISDLGRVTTLNQGSTNVTDSYVDAGKAYRDARATVDSLLERLNSASTPAEADDIEQQLVVAREQLAAARAGLRGLKQRVAYTPVSVDITAQGDGSWSIGDAADDAVGVLEAIAGAALVTLAVLVPLAALIALGWFGVPELNRRRREAALDR
jgi:hypothetical protein